MTPAISHSHRNVQIGSDEAAVSHFSDGGSASRDEHWFTQGLVAN